MWGLYSPISRDGYPPRLPNHHWWVRTLHLNSRLSFFRESCRHLLLLIANWNKCSRKYCRQYFSKEKKNILCGEHIRYQMEYSKIMLIMIILEIQIAIKRYTALCRNFLWQKSNKLIKKNARNIFWNTFFPVMHCTVVWAKVVDFLTGAVYTRVHLISSPPVVPSGT
jgi:hypothetical protein